MFIKTVAILGGAFDPVHQDHLRLALQCLKLEYCDEVWFVPSPDRWDKNLIASPEDRFNMLRLAIQDTPKLVVSDVEINMPDYRGSYMLLQHLQESHPQYRFRLVVGADSYKDIPHWRDPLHFYGTEYNGHLLLKDFELIVFSRKSYPKPDLKKHKAMGYAPLFWVGETQGFVGSLASTQIRKDFLHSREKPKGLPTEVYKYILEHHLYEH